MNDKDLLALEVSKKVAEEEIIKQELENAKNNYINYLVNNINENEIENLKDYNKKVRIHKPLKNKISDFLFKIKKVLGF